MPLKNKLLQSTPGTPAPTASYQERKRSEGKKIVPELIKQNGIKNRGMNGSGWKTQPGDRMQWGSVSTIENQGIGSSLYPNMSLAIDDMIRGNIGPGLSAVQYCALMMQMQDYCEDNEAVMKLGEQTLAAMTENDRSIITQGGDAFNEETDEEESEDAWKKRLSKTYGAKGVKAVSNILNNLFQLPQNYNSRYE